MHRDYVEKCQHNGRTAVSLAKYRQIFKSYNLGFFKPKKDQCGKCLRFSALSENEKKSEQECHDAHLLRKKLAREARNGDKLAAVANPSILAFNFDLESVLNTPKGPSGQIFYMRKLPVYNLTIYNLGNGDGHCYLWDETQGRRGAVEIASCVYSYVMSMDNVKEVRMMSDGCGGQQKNHLFMSMCMLLCRTHPTLQVVDHKFFETGHTEMECDSIHSKIESASKNIPVYVPEGWAQVIRGCRRNPRPFEVHSVRHDEFLQFECSAPKLPIQSVCWLHYQKNKPHSVFYKKSFLDEDFIERSVLPEQPREQPAKESRVRGRPARRQGRGRPARGASRGEQSTPSIPKAYPHPLPIAIPKLKDLHTMIDKLIIPRAHHNYYLNLTSDELVRDALPEPDIEEDESD
ncbi:hypothetical protein GE061_013231 [Apolygus lucorum]|uniref:Uncharacterized protein n=1 Tax=Apolygus lucorum TaxID=248454 RepID=A0A8S9XYL6_APOLU|nr:hypothetical protein GE061_013231 [Apolygus lucorum]